MKNRRNKKITTTVMAMIFALAITMPATSQTAQADAGDYFIEHLTDPEYHELSCTVGGAMGGTIGTAIGVSVIVSGGSSLVLLVPTALGIIVVGALTGCGFSMLTMAAFMGIGAATSGLVDGVKMIFSSEEINESYAVIYEPGDNEKGQVALSDPDGKSGDSTLTLDDIGT